MSQKKNRKKNKEVNRNQTDIKLERELRRNEKMLETRWNKCKEKTIRLKYTN